MEGYVLLSCNSSERRGSFFTETVFRGHVTNVNLIWAKSTHLNKKVIVINQIVHTYFANKSKEENEQGPKLTQQKELLKKQGVQIFPI